MIGGGGPSTSTNHPSNTASARQAHDLIRSILFKHSHNSKNSSSNGKADAWSSRPTSSTTGSTTTSRTDSKSSSLETSPSRTPNHQLYAASGGGNSNSNNTSNTNNTTNMKQPVSHRGHLPKFPSLFMGHHHQGGGNNHHHHGRQSRPVIAGNTVTAGNTTNPSGVRYTLPRKSGVLGRYHRTVGGLQSSGHRRAAAAAARARQHEAQAKAADMAGIDTTKDNKPQLEVSKHAQIQPRPAQAPQAQGQGQPQGQIQGHASQPNYTNVPQRPTFGPTKPNSSSSAAIPIPSHHIKRTASELQLCEDEMRAEYRDRVMYVRCYPAIAGATTARTRRATMQAATTSGQLTTTFNAQEQPSQQSVPSTDLVGTAAVQNACRRSTAPPILSQDSGDAGWLLYDDHPLDGSSPSSSGGKAEPGVEVPDRSTNPRPSYVDDEDAKFFPPSGSPIIIQNPTPPKDVVQAHSGTPGAATATTATAEEAEREKETGTGGGWPVACSQTRRNITILRKASETMYSTTTTSTTNTATTSTATTGTTTTPSSSNPASRATSRTTSREYSDNDADDQMLLDGDGYLEGELHDYEHPGPMQSRSLHVPCGGARSTSGRKNSASSYEDVFVIDDL